MVAIERWAARRSAFAYILFVAWQRSVRLITLHIECKIPITVH